MSIIMTSRVDRHFSGNNQNDEDEAKESYLWVSDYGICKYCHLCTIQLLEVFFFFFFFNSSCLEHLLDNGADPSMVNLKGYSAVHYAAYHGNKQNLELVGWSNTAYHIIFDVSIEFMKT